MAAVAEVGKSMTDQDVSGEIRTNERVPDPCVVVIFGASGDLTKRKLLPALFHRSSRACCPRTSRLWVWRGVIFLPRLRLTCRTAS